MMHATGQESERATIGIGPILAGLATLFVVWLGTSAWQSGMLGVSAPSIPPPPATPEPPSGSNHGYEGLRVRFTASTTEFQGGPLVYAFDWGDGATTWTESAPSNVLVVATHSYRAGGTYAVRVRASSPSGPQSRWSEPTWLDIAEVACRFGNVGTNAGAVPQSVLRVNGSDGGAARLYVTDHRVALDVRLLPSSAGPTGEAAQYAVWLWRQRPSSRSCVDLPHDIGRMSMNPGLNRHGGVFPIREAITLTGYRPPRSRFSVAEKTGTILPGVVMHVPAGRFKAGDSLWIQGVLTDNASPSATHLAVTNGIEVVLTD